MLSLVPAFVGGIPGGIELLVLFFIAFLLFGVPVAVAVFLGYRYVTGQTKRQRIEELEAELASLSERVEGTTGEEPGPTTPDDESATEPPAIEDDDE